MLGIVPSTGAGECGVWGGASIIYSSFAVRGGTITLSIRDAFGVYLLAVHRELCRGGLALEGLALHKQLSNGINT